MIYGPNSYLFGEITPQVTRQVAPQDRVVRAYGFDCKMGLNLVLMQIVT